MIGRSTGLWNKATQKLHNKMKDSYKKPDPSLWKGRTSGKGEYLHEKVGFARAGEDIPKTDGGISFVLLGYACDDGVRRNAGRTGAAQGPDAIRQCLAPMSNHLWKQDALTDMGNITCPHGDLENSQKELSRHVQKIARQGGIPLLLGGGHDISYAHYSGLRSALPTSKSLGIINFDAHFDLRSNENGNHSGSPFYQIAAECKREGQDFQYLCLGVRKEANPRELYDRARQLGAHYLELPHFSMHHFQEVKKRLSEFLSKSDRIYVTVDMDGFSSAYSPGVSASCPDGFTPELVRNCLELILGSGKLMGMDVAETNPVYDTDQQTAKLAAGLLHFVMRGMSLL
jgi:formiminoglutamase